jgi:two-component system, OmpR family, response regulator
MSATTPRMERSAANRDQQTTILLVEDEPITRDILVRYMEQKGLVTRSCSNGEDALSIIRTHGAGFDWLLTDINLPGRIDGWAVGAAFHLRFPLGPVIYASTCAPTLRSNMAGGVYVPKPFSPAKIVEVIQQQTMRNETRDSRTPAVQLADLLRVRREA